MRYDDLKVRSRVSPIPMRDKSQKLTSSSLIYERRGTHRDTVKRFHLHHKPQINFKNRYITLCLCLRTQMVNMNSAFCKFNHISFFFIYILVS